jgi:hypothetical protein
MQGYGGLTFAAHPRPHRIALRPTGAAAWEAALLSTFTGNRI